jgi:hypothetical protein
VRQRHDPGSQVPIPPFTTTLLNLGASVGRWAFSWLRADHTSISGGSWQQNLGGRPHLFFAVACAPSRRFRKPRRVDPLAALAFLNELIPNGFSSPATASHDRLVAFETESSEKDEPGIYREPERVGVVNFNGRVELAVRAPFERQGEELVIELAGAFAYLDRVVELVNRGEYQRLYRLPTRLRRLDWFVALGNNYQHPQFGSRQWKDLRFPGRRPAHRATTSFPWFDNYGLASQRLRSRRQRTKPPEILRPTLIELIGNSGWYDGVDEAVDETIDAAAAGSEAIAACSPISEVDPPTAQA